MILVLLTSLLPGAPTLAIHQRGEDNDIVMAMDDDGNLYELGINGWTLHEVPCPGQGPYRLNLVDNDFAEGMIYIFVFDSKGDIYQTDTEEWTRLSSPVTGTVPPCLGEIYNVVEDSLSTAVMDSTGMIYTNSADQANRSPFTALPAAPALDLQLYYDQQEQILAPFVIGNDGSLYSYMQGNWISGGAVNGESNYSNVEILADSTLNYLFILCVDESGLIYSNVDPEGFSQSPYDPCPGEGPWEVQFFLTGQSSLQLVCLNAAGGLYLSSDFSWLELTDGFPKTQ